MFKLSGNFKRKRNNKYKTLVKRMGYVDDFEIVNLENGRIG